MIRFRTLIIYCCLQPTLVFMSKVDGKFQFSPISVNFLTEVAKVIFAIVMLVIQVCSWLLAPMFFYCACTPMMSHDVIHETPFFTRISCLDGSDFFCAC